MSKQSNLSLKFQLTLFILLCAIAYAFFASTFKVNDGVLVLDSKLWSDFGAHIPLIRSFSMGNNFPPEYPTFPGEPIRYHYLFYLLVGMCESLGLPIDIALNSVSAIGFALLLLMMINISHTLYPRKIAAVMALLLFLFNGTLTFVIFLQEHPLNLSLFSDMIGSTQFTSFGPWDKQLVSAFWNLNIYTNQRHLGLSFGLSLWVVWLILKQIITPRRYPIWSHIIISTILIILPTLHQASFFITLSVSILIILLHPHQLRNTASYVAVILISSIPGIWHLFSSQGSLVSIEPGFLSQPGLNNFIIYWWYNLGLYFFIIPILLLILPSTQKKLLISVFPLFLAANIFKLSPDMINNHKLINFFMIIVVILTAISLHKAFVLRSLTLKILSVIFFILLTLSGLIDLFPIINDNSHTIEDYLQNETAGWIKNNTPEKSIFLTNIYLYNPASLVGRKTYLDYGYFNWSLGYDDSHRKNLLPQIFSPNTHRSKAVCQILNRENISHILLAPGSADLTDIDIDNSYIKTNFVPAYTSQNGYHVYVVSQNCK